VSMLPGVDSKGYLVVKGLGGNTVPTVVARTYNVDPEGGTFGQNLKVFGEADLIWEGGTGYIPGVANSPDPDQGFRTNVGVLNTNTHQGATIAITVYDTDGEVAAFLPEFWIAPGKYIQANIFQVLGVDVDMSASIELRVVSGGPVAAYASEIDNRTQDPILVPAVPVEPLGQ
jgi:hypothetical protein